jgi:hypothetical protein
MLTNKVFMRLELAHNAALVGVNPQHFVVKDRVDSQVIGEPCWELRGAPSPAKEPIHIGSRHCTRVIERKKWIEPDFLEFALSGDRPALSLKSKMLCARKIFL